MMQVCPELQLSLRLDVISSSLNLQTLIFSGDDNMSDLSLLRGVYADVEAYGTLIDKVIERLGRGRTTHLPDPNQKKLGQLLIDTSDQGLESQSLEALTLDSLLRSNTGEPFTDLDLKQLGEHLLSGQVDVSYHKQLETLAQRLERERAEIARQLRGR